MASHPKYGNEECRGIRMKVVDRNAVAPVRLGVQILTALRSVHPDKTVLRNRRFDILTGSRTVRRLIENQTDPEEIFAGWEPGLAGFAALREKYLLYR